MSITNQQYDQMVKSTSPPSKSFKNIPIAFLVGGVICTIGQVILKVFERYNFDKVSASTWVSIILILTSAVLTGFGLYEKLAKHAGAGTLVPITGFANSVVSPALECKTEGFVLGVGAKIFTIAGPVILYGVAASIIYGLIYYLFL
ncbi:MAG: stage V sporulation protein AC [Clostridiales bacterium]|jgi:stage V sporulation protein AC|nr:stage V sporulation protein AC [Clostridiales bacterium]